MLYQFLLADFRKVVHKNLPQRTSVISSNMTLWLKVIKRYEEMKYLGGKNTPTDSGFFSTTPWNIYSNELNLHRGRRITRILFVSVRSPSLMFQVSRGFWRRWQGRRRRRRRGRPPCRRRPPWGRRRRPFVGVFALRAANGD